MKQLFLSICSVIGAIIKGFLKAVIMTLWLTLEFFKVILFLVGSLFKIFLLFMKAGTS